jgi:hypothetical protein
MIEYLGGDARLVNHFLKVYAYAKAIGELEKLDDRTQETLEAAAIVHDIGIPPSIQKYGSAAGKYQETEGPPIAEKMLADLGYDEPTTRRVSYLVGHHHTYTGVDGLDYQILLEADFLVNADEGHLSRADIEGKMGFFRTEAGKRLLRQIYLK